MYQIELVLLYDGMWHNNKQDTVNLFNSLFIESAQAQLVSEETVLGDNGWIGTVGHCVGDCICDIQEPSSLHIL